MPTAAETGYSMRFADVAFRVLPLAVMAAVVAVASATGPGWTARLAAVPWLVSLAGVGLPHGAADFAVSRRAWRGRPLAIVWLAYSVVMAVVLAIFAAAPVTAIVAFTAFSCWHFGTAHLDTARSRALVAHRSVAALARGCLVLAVPLAAWPAVTAGVATDLAALVVGRHAAIDLFPPGAIRVTGLALAAASLLATAAEGLVAIRRPGIRRAWLEVLVELAVIASLGWCTDPLFSVGLYFLAWHGWRQMEPLAESLTGDRPRSWAALGRAVVQVHLAALPLLVPAWVAIGAAWWLLSSDHSPRSLAIVSIAAYLVVTPAHEILGDLLRRMAGLHAQPARADPTPGQAR